MRERGPGDSGLPPLSPLQRILLPVADGFMVAMLSRPPSGTLRTTRVTTVSIVLGTVSFLAFGALGAVLAVSAGAAPLPWLLAVLLEAFALSSLSLTVFGLLQRRPSSV